MTENEMKVVQFLRQHQLNVGLLMRKIIDELIQRAINHDISKFSTEELKHNLEAFPERWRLEEQGHNYDSCEMNLYRKKFASDIKRHQRNNRHHVEFHDNINDMNLIDLIEMLCDWCIASKEANNTIENSIDNNSQKYNIDEQLKQILL